MADLVVTVPKWFWEEWIKEGDPAGVPQSGIEWSYTVSSKPPILPGERLYIVAHDKLRGYAPVTKVVFFQFKWHIIRKGGAVAMTIDEKIPGFRGFRKVWWKREQEKPFKDWKTP